MDNKRADIQQIQKYLNGELDAKAMHRLEREAQDDPFLMEALEGYGSIKNPQLDNLAALQERLQARIATKTRRLIPWTVISIAASVVGFAVVVGLLYKGQQPSPAEKIAATQLNKAKTPDTAATLSNKNSLADTVMQSPQLAFSKPLQTKQSPPVLAPEANVNISQRQSEAVQPNAFDKNSPDTSAMEDKIMGYMAAKRQDTVLGGGLVATTNNAAALTVLNSKAKGADMTVRPGRPADNSAYAFNQAGVPANLVSGIVLDRTNGLPLPGASVKIIGKTTGTQTDVNGKFTLPNVKKDESLSVGYIGYESKTLNVKGADSLKVELNESNSSLSEVVVAPSPKKRKPAKAQPQAGWDAYKKYLKENAVSADDKTGTVELAVTINANGGIGNIRVSKSLSTDADTKAINLINNGPAWNGNTNGKPEEIKVKVEFHKE